MRIALHQAHQVHKALAGHDAIGIHHDHVAIALAPSGAKVGDVPAFALYIFPAVAIKKTFRVPHLLAQFRKCHLFADPNIRIGRITQYEEIEIFGAAGLFGALAGGLDAGKYAQGILIVGGHHHGRARQRQILGCAERAGQLERIASFQLHGKTDGCRPKRKNNRNQQHDEQKENERFEQCEAINLQHHECLPTGQEHSHRYQHSEGEPAGGNPLPGWLWVRNIHLNLRQGYGF